MYLDWSQAYNYAYIAETSEKSQHLNDVIKKIEKRARKVEAVSAQPHLGQNFDTYA